MSHSSTHSFNSMEGASLYVRHYPRCWGYKNGKTWSLPSCNLNGGERNVPSNNRMIPLKMCAETQVSSPRKWHSSLLGEVKEAFLER